MEGKDFTIEAKNYMSRPDETSNQHSNTGNNENRHNVYASNNNFKSPTPTNENLNKDFDLCGKLNSDEIFDPQNLDWMVSISPYFKYSQTKHEELLSI